MSGIQLIGLGALNVDLIYRVERILEDGEAAVQEAAAFPGGSAANTVYALARLGVSTGFIGAVGADADGALLRQDFEKVGVDTSRVRQKTGAKTGTVLCLSDSLGHRSLYVLPGANSLLVPEDIDIDYVNHARLLHISSFVAEEQFRLLPGLMEGLEAAVEVSFSPGALYAAKGLGALRPVLARTHILFVNEAEMKRLTGKDTAAGAVLCLERGCRLVVVTLGNGKEGESASAAAYVRSATEEHYIKVAGKNSTPVADTTGAGDAFAAGFLYGHLKGKGITECGRLGDTLARFAIAQPGARQGLPALSQLSRRYRQLYGAAL